MSALAEALKWMARLMTILPAIEQLWNAVKVNNAQEQMGASLEVIRLMKEQQMKEDLEAQS